MPNAAVRTFSLILGFILLAAGLAGLMPGLLVAPRPDMPAGLLVPEGHGALLGLMPVNIVRDALHLVLGLWGVRSWLSTRHAVIYARAMAALAGVLAVMGLLPGPDTLFGVAPLYGNNVWMHTAIFVSAGFFGFLALKQRVIPLRR
ncbi:MAG TPA: DUF4383 domain-containing protein [Acetobacteraceae bacterium]